MTDSKPIAAGLRRLLSRHAPWVCMFLLAAVTWCCVSWGVSGRSRRIVTESSPVAAQFAAYIFSGKWHANLVGGLLVLLIAAALRGAQSLLSAVRIRYWEKKQGQAWEYVGEARDDTAVHIDGVSIWRQKWQPLDVPPAAVLGRDGEFRRVRVYEIVVDGRRIVFGADECAPGGWAFFRPKRPEMRL